MALAARWRRLLFVGALLGVLGWLGPARAEERSTIHHAGVLRSVDAKSGFLVVDERVRLGPALLARIHVSDATVVVRVRRLGADFRGERVPLDELRAGEFLVVRGVDEGERHHAEMIWSLGPAE